MKIITNKNALKISDELTKQLRLLLISQGCKLKEIAFFRFKYKVYLSLGGKKEKFKN